MPKDVFLMLLFRNTRPSTLDLLQLNRGGRIWTGPIDCLTENFDAKVDAKGAEFYDFLMMPRTRSLGQA
jgi:hypothetical protein